jgi:hypothetical protein
MVLWGTWAALAVSAPIWAGRPVCWSKQFPFSRCCDVSKGSTGDKSCWRDGWTFDTCWCTEPRTCDAAWTNCSAHCTKTYNWSRTNVAACESKLARPNGATGFCRAGEGECTTVNNKNCSRPDVPTGGNRGTCTASVLRHGEGCTLGCNPGYEAYGTGHPMCSNGTVKGIVACKWAGKKECWDSTYTFARCCDTRKSSRGDRNCWGGKHTFATCW